MLSVFAAALMDLYNQRIAAQQAAAPPAPAKA